MKAGRYFALITGIIYLLIGVMGFIPALVTHPAVMPEYISDLGVRSGFGYLLGLFPINTAHNIVHLIVGGLGIAASISLDGSRLYAGLLGVFYGALAIMGLIPVASTTFGLIPIYGNDVWLHAVTAAVAIYFGFFATPSLLQLFNRGEEKAREELSQSG